MVLWISKGGSGVGSTVRIDEAILKTSYPFTIFIVKEALFCTVYEQSAWRFAHAVKSYKPVKKFVKKLGAEVVSLGFPKSQLGSIQDISVAKGFVVTDEPGWMEIRINEEPDLLFEDWKQSVETLHATSLQPCSPLFMSVIAPKKGSVATAIRLFKSGVSKHARQINPDFEWQTRYHDHIIRDCKSYQAICNYIETNPEHWYEDRLCK